MKIFDQGDDTEVGEKGTTCSGGQKARIALARALYSPAKTILLDDVISAVDAQTARHLYVHCLKGPLMRLRTVIIVTHAVGLIAPSSAFIVKLEDGRVVAAGPPSDLIASGDLEVSEEDHSESSTPTSSTLTPNSPHDIIEENLDGLETDALEHQKQVEADKAAPETVNFAKKLVNTETQSSGSVGYETYMMYFRAMGKLPFWVIIVVAFAGSQTLQVTTNAWIKDWVNANDRKSRLRVMMVDHSTSFYLGVYVAIGAAYVFLVAMRTALNYYGGLTASRKLYKQLLKRVLGAKMRWVAKR